MIGGTWRPTHVHNLKKCDLIIGLYLQMLSFSSNYTIDLSIVPGNGADYESGPTARCKRSTSG
jgi:hypothetical protein